MEEKNEVNNNNSNSNSNSNNNNNKVDEVILPGFRFHPTDEELVGFYLRRKILQQSLPIELIKQVDIYKYDPWDLPKLASTGEKEWYFYCPRDRKYRNSARPNRVTCAGFWKATGTDRPIYSSESAKCIGLKKSLVFYRGRAAKGIKTDWMMHEFRLPSLSDSSGPPKKLFDKTLPANDSWAICRIFKKTNSMAQRALSHSWISPLPEIHPISDMFSNIPNHTAAHHFSPENISCTTDHLHGTPSTESFNHVISRADLPTNLMFPTADMIAVPRSTPEVSSMLLNLSPAFTNDAAKPTDVLGFGVSQHQFNGFPVADDQFYFRKIQNQIWNNNTRSIGFPTTLSSWDSSVPCPSELSTSISSNKCYL